MSAATGPATAEQLHELHRLLIAALTDRLKASQPTGEVLAVARAACRDAGTITLDDSGRRKLQRLHKLYFTRLLEAVSDTDKPPSAAIFAEVRLSLAANGVATDLDSALDARAALTALSKSRLPFTH